MWFADEAECSRKVASGRRIAIANRSLVNARILQLEYFMVLHESLFVPVLMDGSERLIWKERSRIRTVLMDNLRSLLGIRRTDKIPNAWIREFCGVVKGMDERIDEAKVFYDGTAMWREWKMIGLLRGSMQGNVLLVAQRGRRGRLIS